MLGWVGLMLACSAAATCVWSAYGLRPSHFDFLRREWSTLTRMEHAWGKAHALLTGGRSVWPPVVNLLGDACKLVTNNNSGQSVAWTIRTVVHPYWTIRLVDNPQVGKTTIHQKFCCDVYLLQ